MIEVQVPPGATSNDFPIPDGVGQTLARQGSLVHPLLIRLIDRCQETSRTGQASDHRQMRMLRGAARQGEHVMRRMGLTRGGPGEVGQIEGARSRRDDLFGGKADPPAADEIRRLTPSRR